MTFRLEKVETPINEFNVPAVGSYTIADLQPHHSLIQRYIDFTTYAQIELTHTIRVVRKLNQEVILELKVECLYYVADLLHATEDEYLLLIEDSLGELNKRYFKLIDGHEIGQHEIPLDVDSESLLLEIKEYIKSTLN